MRSFGADKVKGWSADDVELSRLAESQPHAAFCAFPHCLSSHWLFVSQTVPYIWVSFTMTGCPPPSDNLQLLYALPACWEWRAGYLCPNKWLC